MSTNFKFLSNSKFYEYLIKIMVSILLIWVFYKQLFGRENSEVIIQSFYDNLKNANHFLLFFAIALMPLNWVLEIVKWTTLNKPVEELSFGKSFKAVLAGITFGIVTPHRIGEFGGRVLFLKAKNRIKGIVAMGVGGFAQFLVTVLVGTISLILISYEKTFLPYSTLAVLFFILIVGLVVMAVVFTKLNVLIGLFESIKWFQKFPNFLSALNYITELPQQERFKVLGISFVRYFIYVMQYVLLIKYLGLVVPFYLAFVSTALIFLIQTGIPLPPVLGLLARGEIAILVWSIWDANEASVLCATFLLWTINLGIPALIGVVIILKENLIKSNKYETAKT